MVETKALLGDNAQEGFFNQNRRMDTRALRHEQLTCSDVAKEPPFDQKVLSAKKLHRKVRHIDVRI